MCHSVLVDYFCYNLSKQSIANFMEKIKGILKNSLESEKGKDVLIVIIVVLVGLISFELGRLSINQSAGIKIEYPEGEAIETNNQANVISASQISYTSPKATTATGKAFFASNRGKKYYSIGC